MTTTTKIFQFLGFSQRSQKIYSLIIQRGLISASILAEELNIPRSTVYFELDHLQRTGLISITGSLKKRKFTVENPDRLLELVEAKTRQAKKILPLTREASKEISGQIASKGWNVPDIKFFRGVEGVKKVLNAATNARSKKILAIMPAYDLYTILGEKYWQELVKKRIKNKVVAQNIWPIGQEMPTIVQEHIKKHREHLHKVKFSKEQLHFNSAIFTFDETVSFITSTEELFSIQIKSYDLAQAIEALFRMLWKHARNNPN